jgi:hypothetical protein
MVPPRLGKRRAPMCVTRERLVIGALIVVGALLQLLVLSNIQ